MNGNRKSQSEGALLIAMIAIGIGVIGWVLPTAKTPVIGCVATTIEQCGTVSVSVFGGGGSASVGFSPVFASAPTVVLGPKSWTLPFASSSVPTTTFDMVSTNSTMCNVVAFCGAAPSNLWLNMISNLPVAKTEIYSAGTYPMNRRTVDVSDVTGFRFGVDCIGGSLGANALFRLEYTIDGGASFSALNVGSDYRIGTTSADCVTYAPSLGSLGYHNNAVSYYTIPANATGTIILRVVSIGGIGAGDQTVAFGRVWVDFQLKAAGDTGFNVCMAYWIPNFINPKAFFTVNIRCVSNTVSGTFTVSWIASI